MLSIREKLKKVEPKTNTMIFVMPYALNKNINVSMLGDNVCYGNFNLIFVNAHSVVFSYS